MAEISISKIVNSVDQALIISEIEKELKKRGNLSQYVKKAENNTFTFENDETLKLKGKISVMTNTSKNISFVEVSLTTKEVRGSGWWFVMGIGLLCSGGLALSYIGYHYLMTPSTTIIQSRA